MNVLWISQMNADDPTHVSLATQTETSRALRMNGHAARLVVGGFSRRETDDYTTWPVRTRLDRIMFQVRTLAEIRGLAPDCVVLDQEYQVHVVALARTLGLIPRRTAVVCDIRTLPVSENAGLVNRLRHYRFRSAVRLASMRLDGLTTITDDLARRLTAFGATPASVLGIWSSGCWTEAGSESPRSTNGDQPVTFVYLGALVSGRALEVLPSALQLVIQAGSRAHLVFIGDGPLRSGLQNSVSKLRLERNVRFFGTVPHEKTRALLERCDYGVSPLPRRECWEVSSPLKVLEYLAAGLPVIYTPLEAHERVLASCNCCVPAVSTSAEALADAMQRAASRHVSREDRNECRNLARQFDWRSVAAGLESALALAIRRRMVQARDESGSCTA